MPQDQLGVLVEPGAEVLRAATRKRLESPGPGTPWLDSTLGALRRALRAQLGLTGPVVLTGHQPEFFHAGVFAKTIAAHELACQLNGVAAFLTVDSDVPKTTKLVLPQVTSHGLRRVDVVIPGSDPQLPHESQLPVSRAVWLQFFASATSLHEFGDRSLLPTFARAWLTTPTSVPLYCDALARAHAAVERALGLDGIRELRTSALCATPAFRAFLAHMLLDAPGCAARYNAAQAAYRRRHRVKTRGRPVPPLLIRNDVVELPLWAVREDEPRRRVLVRPHADVVELGTDHRTIAVFRRVDLMTTAWHAQAWSSEREGWYLRPRALTLSTFARLFLADLFIHGIGGARYDEMMEEFAAEHFGVEPWPMACVTATVFLPLPHQEVAEEDLRRLQWLTRDLRCNPQRHLKNVPPDLRQRRADLVRQSKELAEHRPGDREARRTVFREIRRVSEQMLQTDPWCLADVEQRIETLRQQQALAAIARDREYFYALHTQETLEQLVRAVRAQLV